MEETKILEDSIQRYLGYYKALSKNVQNGSEKMENIRYGILTRKQNEKDLKYIDVKDDLLNIQATSFDISLKMQDMDRYALFAAELYSMAKENKVEVLLSDEDEKLLEEVVSSMRSLFHINNNTQTVGIVDLDVYNNMLERMKSVRATDQELERMFNSPAFNPPTAEVQTGQ